MTQSKKDEDTSDDQEFMDAVTRLLPKVMRGEHEIVVGSLDIEIADDEGDEE